MHGVWKLNERANELNVCSCLVTAALSLLWSGGGGGGCGN